MNSRSVAVLCLLSAAVPLAIVIGGPRLMARTPKQRLASVDLTAIIANSQQQAVKDILGSETDPAKRKAAQASAEAFGRRMNAAVAELARDCGCVLLMREAIVAGEVEDLTAVLASRMGAAKAP
jgi:hypothetical protein